DSASFSPWHPAIYAVTAFSSLLLILGALFWRRREHRGASTVDLVIAMIAFTMASPIAWDFHYGILAPVYAVLLPALLRRPVWGRWTIGLLALSYVLSSNYFDALLYAARFTWLTPLQSMLFFSVVFVLVTAVRLRRAEHLDDAPPA